MHLSASNVTFLPCLIYYLQCTVYDLHVATGMQVIIYSTFPYVCVSVSLCAKNTWVCLEHELLELLLQNNQPPRCVHAYS